MFLLDMSDFVFFLLNDGSIRKVLLTDEALQDIVSLWERSYSKFFSEEITEVVFDGSYKPGKEEVLYVTMDLPKCFADIPNNTNNYNEIVIPEDSIKTVCLYHDGNYYFQNFMNNYIVKASNIALIWSNNTFKKLDEQKAFTIEETVNAIYHNGRLYFRSYASARQIFDLSEYYKEATNADIECVFGEAIFAGTDCEWMKDNSDSVMRKQIKSIEDSGILEGLDVTKREFKSWAKKAGIPKEVYNTGSLVFPKNKKICKMILSFLNDDIFEGYFTKSIFLSNSKRKP